MRRLIALSAILLLAGGSAMIGPARAGGTLSRIAGAEPQTLDPHRTAGGLETAIESDLYEGLTARGPDGRVLPGVADHWEVTADGKAWTFHLRPDARWSNGTPLTADDFVFAFRRELDARTHAPMASQLANLTGAEAWIAGNSDVPLDVVATDAHTLHLGLVRPSPFLPEMLSYPFAMPVYRPDVEADPANWSKAAVLVSNGPFVLAERVPQLALVLHRNPQFHDADKVALDEVRWRVLENDATALKLYRTGEVDIASVSDEDLEPARRTLPGDLHIVPIFGTEFVIINLRRQPLGTNLALRRALALAIDRTVLTDNVDPTGGTRSCSYVPAHSPGYQGPTMEGCGQPIAQRRMEAKALVASAGLDPKTPLKIALIHRTNRLDRKRLAAIVEMWKPLGIELELVNREWRTYLDALMNGDYDLAIAKIVGASGDPLEFLNGMRAHGEINVMGYVDEAFEALMHSAEDEPDPARRSALLGEAEQRLLTAVPLIPLDTPVERMLVRSRVHGWQDNEFAFHPSRWISIGP
ncbi:MAG TPA: peptide ABC transporter substrate-binding protein [Aliidongia sp.]|uniref:peptide ABC transporter substrate-binding protein n=1 Tax=Aliidongia sp. TaxID=1914230 RepID=UPI002DDD9D0F|nr:peptide ABC transporter substrate-binding protein [Aliidongia sp.]HEV2673891.1 peptide ABC transporter substrate-binding protein [Aliidongia sp.]